MKTITQRAKKDEDFAEEIINKKKITKLKKVIDNMQKEKKIQQEILKKVAEEKIELECEIFKPFLK